MERGSGKEEGGRGLEVRGGRCEYIQCASCLPSLLRLTPPGSGFHHYAPSLACSSAAIDYHSRGELGGTGCVRRDRGLLDLYGSSALLHTSGLGWWCVCLSKAA